VLRVSARWQVPFSFYNKGATQEQRFFSGIHRCPSDLGTIPRLLDLRWMPQLALVCDTTPFSRSKHVC
jgi:hypothetical protein